MAVGNVVGSAVIEVRADASHVGDDLSAEAERALVEAAQNLGDTLGTELDESVRRSTDGLGDGLSEELDRGVKKSAGKFQESLRRSLTKAVADLPDIQIGAATTEADQKLRDLTVRLGALRDAEIGVDLDSGAALAELIELSTELAALAASDVNIDVRVDAAAAHAQLATVLAQVRDVDNNHPRIEPRVDDGQATSVLSRLVSALFSVGSAGTGGAAQAGGSLRQFLIPAIAAAVLALGALVPAAVAALGTVSAMAAGIGAGAGVMMLGFSGVGDTMKLLDRRAAAAATSAGKSAGSQVSSAAAVESAARSLANTQANAAEAAVKAAERVVEAQQEVADAVDEAARKVADAERNLARDQRDALSATLALTAARKAEQERLDNLTESVDDNARAQRKAALSVAEAKTALDKVLRNRRATAAMREDAQLAYDDAVDQQTDLQREAARLGEAQADAAAKGIEGSDLVVAAQERLLEAQEKVADSQRDLVTAQLDGARAVADAQKGVTDALREQQSQARQSAFSIEQATAALAAAGAAGASASAAGASALAGINDELAKVNPATLAFATFMQDRVMPAIQRIKDAAADNMLPGVQKGLESLLPMVPRLEEFAGNIGSVLGGIFTDLGDKVANDPFWADFVDQLENVAGPALQDAADAAYNLIQGLAGILEAFFPLTDDMGDGLVGMTEDFANWGKQLKDDPSFHEFIDDVKDAIPKIVEAFQILGDTMGDAWDFFEEHGDEILSILNQIGDAAEDVTSVFSLGDQLQAELDTAGETISGWYDTAKEWGGDIVDGIVDGLGELKDKAQEKWEEFVQNFKDFFGIHSPSTLFTAFGGDILQGLLDGLASLGSSLTGMFSGAWTSVSETTSTGIDTVIGWVSGLPGRAGAALGSLAGTIGGAVSGAFSWATGAVSNGIETMLTFLRGLPGRAASAIGSLGSTLYNAGRDLIQGLVNGISAAASFTGGVARAVVNSVIGFLNSQVIDRINNLLDFTIPVKGLPDIHINPPDIGRIPQLANGAIVDRPTLAVIGEAGPEAVIPLSAGRAGRRAALMDEAGLSGGAGMSIDARQTYIVRDSQSAQEVGAVVGQRIVRDLRSGVTSRYTGAAA